MDRMDQATRDIPKKARATLAFRIAGRLSAVVIARSDRRGLCCEGEGVAGLVLIAFEEGLAIAAELKGVLVDLKAGDGRADCTLTLAVKGKAAHRCDD